MAMNPEYQHPPPPRDYPNLHYHLRKSSRKGGKLFRFILLIELILLLSITASYLILTAVKEQKTTASSISPITQSNYFNLFRNYRILDEFFTHPTRTDPIQDAEFEIDNPFIVDIINLKNAALDFEENREKNADRIGNIILDIESKHNPHPHRYSFILHKKNKLNLKYLYFVKNYDELITRYNTSPHLFDTLELKLFVINSFLRTGNVDQAFEMFKDLFADNRLKSFEDYLPRRTLNSFIRRLDNDYWFKKFKYLAKTNQYSEFLRERPYTRNPQLTNLVNAEFSYKQKQYDQSRKFLDRVRSEEFLAYKERIIFKMDLREENTDNYTEKLAVLQQDPEVFLEVLFDAASILLINGNWDLSMDFYMRYTTYSELFRYIHLMRSHYPPPMDANYWKALWITAWINYKKKNKPQAAFYFKQGIDSPILSYRIANRYWLKQLDKETTHPVNLDKYPFTYYFTRNKQPQDYHYTHISLIPFIDLLNQEQGSNTGNIIKDLKNLVYYNLTNEAIDLINWTTARGELNTADKHTLMLIESILYLRKENYAMAFISYRDNFDCYQCIRLPRFLSQIALPIKYTDLIDQYCETYKLDKSLILALIREESFFRSNAVSPANAYGLMQLLLNTARQVAYPHGMKVFRPDLLNPQKNIRLGTEYLKQLLDKYNGKLPQALAAYNAGWERVDEWMNRFGTVKDDEFIEMIPFTETRNYVKNILRNYYYYRFYYGNHLK